MASLTAMTSAEGWARDVEGLSVTERCVNSVLVAFCNGSLEEIGFVPAMGVKRRRLTLMGAIQSENGYFREWLIRGLKFHPLNAVEDAAAHHRMGDVIHDQLSICDLGDLA